MPCEPETRERAPPEIRWLVINLSECDVLCACDCAVAARPRRECCVNFVCASVLSNIVVPSLCRSVARSLILVLFGGCVCMLFLSINFFLSWLLRGACLALATTMYIVCIYL